MKKIIQIWTIAVFICSIIGASLLPSIIAADGQQNEIKVKNEEGQNTGKVTNAAYTGHLRVYIVEPASQWNNYNKEPYHFGFHE